MEVKIQITDDRGQVYHGVVVLTKEGKSQKKNIIRDTVAQKPKKIKPSDVINRELYQKNFFKSSKFFPEVEKSLNALGYNFKKGSVLMALKGAEYLIKSGKKGNYKFSQKYPPVQ